MQPAYGVDNLQSGVMHRTIIALCVSPKYTIWSSELDRRGESFGTGMRLVGGFPRELHL